MKNEMQEKKQNTGEDRKGFTLIEPVSYTHLDVYKRQIHGWSGKYRKQ